MQAPAHSDRESVLVVDDDSDIREAIQLVAEVEGYPVATARDGEEALRTLRSGLRPCLILLDLRMPGMDGRTFLHRKLGDARIAHIPVVVITGDQDGPGIARSLGIDCVLVKPIDLDRLLQTIARFCQPR